MALAPYGAHVNGLRGALPDCPIRIMSVDAAQGTEAEVVIRTGSASRAHASFFFGG
jgi:hypothetical protein